MKLTAQKQAWASTSEDNLARSSHLFAGYSCKVDTGINAETWTIKRIITYSIFWVNEGKTQNGFTPITISHFSTAAKLPLVLWRLPRADVRGTVPPYEVQGVTKQPALELPWRKMVFPTIVFSRPYVNKTLLCTGLFSSFISLHVGLELLSKAPVRTDCLKLKADFQTVGQPLRLVSWQSRRVSVMSISLGLDPSGSVLSVLVSQELEVLFLFCHSMQP